MGTTEDSTTAAPDDPKSTWIVDEDDSLESTDDSSSDDNIGDVQAARSFTTKEVNELISKRLAREKAKYADLKQFKDNAEKQRLASLSEHEQAIENAKREVATKYAERIAAAEVRAALVSLVDDPSAIVEELNMTRYVTEDGDVDQEAIASLKAKYTKLLGAKKPKDVQVGQGFKSTKVISGTPLDDFTRMLQAK